MSQPSHDAGREIYFALQRLARQQDRDTQELLTLYALEGILARLEVSPYREQLVIKGGMLLAAFAQRRPTRDLDFHAYALARDGDTVRNLIVDIAAISLKDGLIFDTANATAQMIREDDQYNGVRVSLDGNLFTAKLSVKVDVNVGDPGWPAPQDVSFPRLLTGEPLRLRGYPLHMVLAEKLVTALERGMANTRWRDFADMYLLCRNFPLDGTDLVEATARVAKHRGVELFPVDEVLNGFAEFAQSRWVVWRARHDLADRLPETFAVVVSTIAALGGPVVTKTAVNARWDPILLSWDVMS